MGRVRTRGPGSHDDGLRPVDHALRPTTLAVDGALAATKAMGQDRYGVPRPPPLTEPGRWRLAWDRTAGVRPGDTSGVVRPTAHTYRGDGAHAPALGNLLLTRSCTGSRLDVAGS